MSNEQALVAGKGNGNTNQDSGPQPSTYAKSIVAQSTTMAVQNAQTFLNYISIVSAAGIAVCTEKMIEQKEEAALWEQVIQKITTNMQSAADLFKKISEDAQEVMAKFNQ
ncbi:MAG TPA: hypothetical protein PKW95_22815 [bacterium]|nr:hypothetical protein [bacterium]